MDGCGEQCPLKFYKLRSGLLRRNLSMLGFQGGEPVSPPAALHLLSTSRLKDSRIEGCYLNVNKKTLEVASPSSNHRRSPILGRSDPFFGCD